jgi:hypothetical protein
MSSLLFILIVVLLVIAVAVFGPRFLRALGIKLSLIIIGAYLSVLVILTVITLLISPSALRQPAAPALDANRLGEALSFSLPSGNYDAPEGYTSTANSYQLSADSITVSGQIYGEIYIGVKGTDVPDDGSGQVDVISYAAGSMSFDGADYPVPINLPVCDYIDGALTISPAPEKGTVTICRFDDARTVTPFLGSDYSSGYGSASELAVVVLLPPGVTCTGDGTQPLSALLKPVEQ